MIDVVADGGCALVGVSNIPCWCAAKGGRVVFTDKVCGGVDVVLP